MQQMKLKRNRQASDDLIKVRSEKLPGDCDKQWKGGRQKLAKIQSIIVTIFLFFFIMVMTCFSVNWWIPSMRTNCINLKSSYSMCVDMCIYACILYCIMCLLASDCLITSNSQPALGPVFGKEGRGNNFISWISWHMQSWVSKSTAHTTGSQSFSQTTEVKHTGLHFPDALQRPHLWINKRHPWDIPRIHCSMISWIPQMCVST